MAGKKVSIYNIWLERNQMLFEGKNSHKQDTLRIILHTIRSRVLHLNLLNNSSSSCAKIAKNFNLPVFNIERVPKFCRWIPLDPSFLKLNFDASLSVGEASMGGIIRNQFGESLGCYSLVEIPSSIHELELEAVLHGFVLAVQLNANHLWIESDSTNAVQVIKGFQKCPWRKIGTLCSIRTTLQKFESWKISHVWRESNMAVDILSKCDYHVKGVSILSNFWSPSLNVVNVSDASGTTYEKDCNLLIFY
ncbi:uncharacterized protein LOC143888797 [Tasmannia lanceolata]|uniref:uncharacterized protein LOC143888797 n=1 Tax=Tasmannia lanceolata TaxID=3420 RepID=UPI004064A4A2